MMHDIFKNWFHFKFVPEVSEFLKSKGLPQKAVLFLDICNITHPTHGSGHHSHDEMTLQKKTAKSPVK